MNDKQLIWEVYEKSKLFGPVYHRTKANLKKLSDYDASKSQESGILGAAIYCTLEHSKDSWNPTHLKGAGLLKAYVRGNIIDLTKPLEQKDLNNISKLLGRKIDYLPVISLEKRFGSVANGLKEAGYSAAIHLGPAKREHIAIFSPEFIVD